MNWHVVINAVIQGVETLGSSLGAGKTQTVSKWGEALAIFVKTADGSKITS